MFGTGHWFGPWSLDRGGGVDVHGVGEVVRVARSTCLLPCCHRGEAMVPRAASRSSESCRRCGQALSHRSRTLHPAAEEGLGQVSDRPSEASVLVDETVEPMFCLVLPTCLDIDPAATSRD